MEFRWQTVESENELTELPTPYYQDNQVTLYVGDCMDLMPLLRADCIIADPPYEVTSIEWDRWVDGWFKPAADLLTPHNGSMWCFGSMKMFLDRSRFGEFDGWKYGQDVVWEKHNGSALHNDRFRRVHEIIVHWYPDGVAWGDVYKDPQYTYDATARTVRRKQRPNHWGGISTGEYESHDGGPRLMRSVIRERSCHGRALQTGQKPEPLLARLMTYSCPKGGVVLDPFAGSSSTLETAKRTGRRAIGIEISEDRARAGTDRLTQSVLIT